MSKRTFVSLAFCLAGIFALYGQEENQNNYGVDEANTKFSLQSGVLGGETNYTYLSLKDILNNDITYQIAYDIKLLSNYYPHNLILL